MSARERDGVTPPSSTYRRVASGAVGQVMVILTTFGSVPMWSSTRRA